MTNPDRMNEAQWSAVDRFISDALIPAASEIASGSKLGLDATKKLPGEGFKRPWPPLIKMDAAVKAKVEKFFGGVV